MFLQREDPLIPVLHDQMVSFLTKLAGKFLPVATIRAAEGDFYTIKYRECEDQLQGLDKFYHTNTLHACICASRSVGFCWNYDKESTVEPPLSGRNGTKG